MVFPRRDHHWHGLGLSKKPRCFYDHVGILGLGSRDGSHEQNSRGLVMNIQRWSALCFTIHQTKKKRKMWGLTYALVSIDDILSG
jgi:hypothetical protein